MRGLAPRRGVFADESLLSEALVEPAPTTAETASRGQPTAAEPMMPSPTLPQPAEGEQFGALPPAPMGTPHMYERMASLRTEIRPYSGPSLGEIALEAHRLLQKAAEPISSGPGGRAQEDKYASGEPHENDTLVHYASEGAVRANSTAGYASQKVGYASQPGAPPKAGGQRARRSTATAET